MRYFADTSILSYFVRESLSEPDAFLHLVETGDVAISVCVKAELLYGARLQPEATKRNQRLDQVLLAIKILPWGDAAADHYAAIAAHLKKTGKKVGQFDEMIGAHAVSLNLVMITNNLRHFSRIPGLAVTNWPI